METAGAKNQPKEIEFDLVRIKDVIATGSYGVILKGQMFEEEWGNKPTTVAFKYLKDSVSGDLAFDFDREVTAMSALNHANILRLLGVTSSEEGTRYMIFEYMVKGSLDSWLVETGRTFGEVNGNKAINELSLVDIGLQIAEGMAYMASKNFVHRDLAARNVLLAEDLRVRIADFGLARDIEKQGYYQLGASRVYPLRWTAPESIQTSKFNSQSDVWSFGVLLWEIFSHGKVPYEQLDTDTIKENKAQGIHLEKPDTCPDDVYDLMKDCWILNPDNRPQFQTIFERMHHITEQMLLTPVLQSWILWLRHPESNKPALGGWDIAKLPVDIRERWGLEHWPHPLLLFLKPLTSLSIPKKFI